MENQWYVKLCGFSTGPYPKGKLQDWLNQGRLSEHTMVYHAKLGKWKAIGDFHNFTVETSAPIQEQLGNIPSFRFSPQIPRLSVKKAETTKIAITKESPALATKIREQEQNLPKIAPIIETPVKARQKAIQKLIENIPQKPRSQQTVEPNEKQVPNPSRIPKLTKIEQVEAKRRAIERRESIQKEMEKESYTKDKEQNEQKRKQLQELQRDHEVEKENLEKAQKALKKEKNHILKKWADLESDNTATSRVARAKEMALKKAAAKMKAIRREDFPIDQAGANVSYTKPVLFSTETVVPQAPSPTKKANLRHIQTLLLWVGIISLSGILVYSLINRNTFTSQKEEVVPSKKESIAKKAFPEAPRKVMQRKEASANSPASELPRWNTPTPPNRK